MESPNPIQVTLDLLPDDVQALDRLAALEVRTRDAQVTWLIRERMGRVIREVRTAPRPVPDAQGFLIRGRGRPRGSGRERVKCRVPNCAVLDYSRGLCRRHYHMQSYYQAAGCLTEAWLVSRGKLLPRPGDPPVDPAEIRAPIKPAGGVYHFDKLWFFGLTPEELAKANYPVDYRSMTPDGGMPDGS